MKIYTIGFTKKRAESFFELLRQNGIQRVVDIRINPNGQLSGFAKKDDLPYFLSMLVPGCRYVHMPELAPTKEILKDYRSDSDWSRYVNRFGIPESLESEDFETSVSCLLCSEATPDQCHRRLVAERLAKNWPDVEIIHL